MRLRTRIALIVDNLLDWLPGQRGNPSSIEARVRKAMDRNTAKLIAEAEHLDALVVHAEQKAQHIVDQAIRVSASLHSKLEALRESGLIDRDDEGFLRAWSGTAVAGNSPDTRFEKVETFD